MWVSCWNDEVEESVQTSQSAPACFIRLCLAYESVARQVHEREGRYRGEDSYADRDREGRAEILDERIGGMCILGPQRGRRNGWERRRRSEWSQAQAR